MKKLFPIAFFSAALMFVACGDDSSSGPEEESSSSIEVEDESSSSVEEGKSSAKEEEGKSSANEEGKSSAADKKSSSSEAKKGDSSSSEEATSSSSETVSSSSHYSTEPTCTTKMEGNVLTGEYTYYGTEVGDVKVVMAVDYVKNTLTLSSQGILFTFGSCTELQTSLSKNLSFEAFSCSDAKKYYDVTINYKEGVENNFGTIDVFALQICGFLESGQESDTYALNQKMLEDGKYGTFRDTRDAMLYYTIEIGEQTWMAQNLNYATSSGSSCYDNVEGNCFEFGRLYTWDAAKSACPTGWHLPTKDDITKLVVNVDSDFGGTTGPFDHGDKLMTENWGGDSNEIGFSAVPAGYYVDAYKYAGSDAYFWVQIETTVPAVMFLTVKESGFGLGMLGGVQMSVRCIKDDAPSQSVSSN